MKSSFKKKGVKAGVSFAESEQTLEERRLQPGTRLSTHNGLPMISSGVPSIDDVFGGGLPLGSLLLIKEDRTTSYATTLLQYFLSQCAVQLLQGEGNMVLVSAEGDLLSTLPWLPHKSTNVSEQPVEEEQDMTIAWRYKNQPKFSSQISAAGFGKSQSKETSLEYCNVFDLTTRIPPSSLNHLGDKVVKIDPKDESLDWIFGQLPKSNSSTPIRIAVNSFASPAWTGWSEVDLVKFLLKLRFYVRQVSGVAVVTLPAYLYGDAPGLGINHMVRRWEHMADAVIEVESFEGTARRVHAAYAQDYHGLLYIRKLFQVDSITPSTRIDPANLQNLAFKCRRRKFQVETLHLPPELETTTERIGDEDDAKPVNPNNLNLKALDF